MGLISRVSSRTYRKKNTMKNINSECSKPKRIKPEKLTDKSPKKRKAIKNSYKQAKKDRKAERAKIREAKLARKISVKKSKSLKRPNNHGSLKPRLNQLHTTSKPITPKA